MLSFRAAFPSILRKWEVSTSIDLLRDRSDSLINLVKAFDAWAERCNKSMPLTCLKDSIVGVDAAYYLAHFLVPGKEPLLAALGGQPFALESNIIRELDDCRAAGFNVHFVFDGLDWGYQDEPFKASILDSFTSAAAFETYEKDMPSEAIKVFKKSGEMSHTSLRVRKC